MRFSPPFPISILQKMEISNAIFDEFRSFTRGFVVVMPTSASHDTTVHRIFHPFLFMAWVSVLFMTQCRHRSSSQSHEFNSHAISVRPRLTLIGDTTEQLWTWQQLHRGSLQTQATLRVKRRKGSGHSSLLHFPESISYHRTLHREGKTSVSLITGYLPDKQLLFQRMRCDLPGELDLEVRLTPSNEATAATLPLSPDQQHDRQILHSAAPATQCWLLPFESEVTEQNNQLYVKGEGELLILWHLASSPEQLADDWRELLIDYLEKGAKDVDLSKFADRLEDAAKASMK